MRDHRDPALRLRGRLLGALGVALVGCGDFDNYESAGVTTDPSGGDIADQGTDTDVTTTEDGEGTTDEGTTDEGTTGEGTTGMEESCDYVEVVDEPGWPSEWPFDCPTAEASDFDTFGVYKTCTEAEPGADCESVCGSYGCGDLGECADEGASWGSITESCPPYYDAELGMCCSLMVTGEEPWDSEEVEGRPFRPDAGPMRLASSREGSGWSDAIVLDELAPDVRERLAAHWRRVALAEHASIASFARFVGELVRFAAPPELIRDALAAAGDEVRHAREAFTLASRYAGRPIAAGRLATRDALDAVDDLDMAVLAAVREGCVAETLAAHEAAMLANEAGDPRVAAVLERIADDESRHAELAWRFVAWALERRPELRTKVAALLGSLAGGRDRSVEPSASEALLLAHGCASERTRTTWRRRGVEQVVHPCARALLG